MYPPERRVAPTRSGRRRTLAAWALTALCLGCAAGPQENPYRPRAGREAVFLEVENRYWSDMTISVRRGAQMVRLGQVTTNNRGRFQIPGTAAAAGASVRFVADPVGSGQAYASPIVALNAGDAYLWTLAVSIEHSTLVRR